MNPQLQVLMGSMVGPPTSDPFLSSVVLRLMGDSADGNTTFTDVSSKANVMTPHGTIAHSADTAPFGTTSIKLPGSSYLTGPTGVNFQFGTGAYTLECWCNATSLAVVIDLLAFCAPGSATGTIMQIATTGKLAATTYTNQFMPPAGTSIATGTWHHVAMTKDATTTRLFLDGVLQSSLVGDGVTNSDGVCGIGATTAPAGIFTGYLKDVRITKGVARYTANFPIWYQAFPLV